MMPPLLRAFAASSAVLWYGLYGVGMAYAVDPITSRNDEVGTLLNQWAKDFSAAGLGAISYENRDGNHSPLPVGRYLKLGTMQPTESEIKAGRGTGMAVAIRPSPTLGNCSMASKAIEGGSIPRLYFSRSVLQAFLFEQYLHNNLFIYPEHQDYDPGANGLGGGWGDLLPANVPTLLISQGSSYLDMPFVNAFLATTAAFRPEIQQLLIRNRILMPTLQAIFRQSNKQVLNEEDYFTGKAHPPVFDGAQIDELKMVNTAHLMSALSVPPLAFMEVVSERKAVPWVDFFEPAGVVDEGLGTTPANVARVFRSTAAEYAMTLSAKRSLDPGKRALTYRWAVLQGDPALVKIHTADNGQTAMLKVRWHSPLRSSNGIRSHRVDVGLFTSNGISTSAPAIVSFYMLPNERRFFDAQGRLSEVCYEAGNPELGLPSAAGDERWLAFLELLAVKDTTLPHRLLERVVDDEIREVVRPLWSSLRDKKRELDALASDPKNKAQVESLRGEFTAAMERAMKQKVKTKSGAEMALLAFAEQSMSGLADLRELYSTLQVEIMRLAAASPLKSAETDLRAELKRLQKWGVLVEDAAGKVMANNGVDKLSEAERYYLRQLHLTVLSQVLYPGLLERSPAPLHTDGQLTALKSWRDLYRYDEGGKCLGWLRFYEGRMLRFDAQGRLLPEGNGKPQAVRYEAEAGRLVFKTE